MCIKYLEKPLTSEEISSIADKDNRIEAVVAVHEDELLYADFDDFLGLISEKLCGDKPLYMIDYRMIGCIPEKNLILYSILGDATCILEDVLINW